MTRQATENEIRGLYAAGGHTARIDGNGRVAFMPGGTTHFISGGKVTDYRVTADGKVVRA